VVTRPQAEAILNHFRKWKNAWCLFMGT